MHEHLLTGRHLLADHDLCEMHAGCPVGPGQSIPPTPGAASVTRTLNAPGTILVSRPAWRARTHTLLSPTCHPHLSAAQSVGDSLLFLSGQPSAPAAKPTKTCQRRMHARFKLVRLSDLWAGGCEPGGAQRMPLRAWIQPSGLCLAQRQFMAPIAMHVCQSSGSILKNARVRVAARPGCLADVQVSWAPAADLAGTTPFDSYLVMAAEAPIVPFGAASTQTGVFVARSSNTATFSVSPTLDYTVRNGHAPA